MKLDFSFLEQIPGLSQGLGALFGVVLAILAAVGLGNTSSTENGGFDLSGSSAIVGQAFGEDVQAKEFPFTGGDVEDGLYYKVIQTGLDSCTVALANWKEGQPVVGTVWSVSIDGAEVASESVDEVAAGVPVSQLPGLPVGADKYAGLYFAKVGKGTHTITGTFTDGPNLSLKNFAFTSPTCSTLL